MKVIKELIKENKLKTVVIQRFFRTIQVDKERSSNPGATDIFYLIKYLREECGIEPILQYHTKGKPKGDYNWKSYSQIDWSNVDLCINQTNLFNLFGGAWQTREVESIVNWTENYNGLTYIMYTDPAIIWTSPIRLIIEGGRNKCSDGPDFDLDPSLIEKFDSKNIESLFIGRNYDLFMEMCKPSSNNIWPKINHQFDLVPYIIEHEWSNISKNNTIPLFANEIQNKDSKKYDLVYFGSKRSARAKVLRNLFKESELNKLWIGYDPNFKNTLAVESQPRNKLVDFVELSKLSFVVGDPAHNDNMFTYRIFENAIMDTLSVIWDDFDPSHFIFNHKELSKFYVKTIEDVVSLCKELEDPKKIKYYLKLQQDVIRDYSKSWK